MDNLYQVIASLQTELESTFLTRLQDLIEEMTSEKISILTKIKALLDMHQVQQLQSSASHGDFLCKNCLHTYDDISEETEIRSPPSVESAIKQEVEDCQTYLGSGEQNTENDAETDERFLDTEGVEHISIDVKLESQTVIRDQTDLFNTLNHNNVNDIEEIFGDTEDDFSEEPTPSSSSNTTQLLCNSKSRRPYKMSRSISKLNEPKMFKCAFCGKLFGRKQTLIVHHRVHTGERPYKCSECEKAFKDGAALGKHKKLHTRILPFPCELCYKSFASEFQLSVHIQSNHHSNAHFFKIHKQKFI